MKLKTAFNLLLIVFLLFVPFRNVSAQSPASGPVYIIQPGDTLNVIAIRFDVSVEDLIRINNIDNPNMLSAGTELVIPGLEGVQGRLETEVIPLGENIQSLSRRYRIPIPMLAKLNHLTSPVEIYAGSNLIIPQDDQNKPLGGRTVLTPGQTLVEAAAVHNTSTWGLISSNHLEGSWDSLPGSALYFSAKEGEEPAGSPIPLVNGLSVEALPLVQGKTETVRVSAQSSLQLTGSLNGRELQFFQQEQDKFDYVAIQGVHAMAAPGLVPFVLKGKAENGQGFEFEQMVLLQAGGYAQDPPLFVDPVTIDPANTKPEDDQIKLLTTPASPTRYWDGIFRQPVDEPACIKSWYGTRRSYNGSDYTYFHTGADYGVCANLNIYAPAAGIVVFTGPLTVRGNATIIDHGWGIYSGIYHQSEIKVNVGDKVEAGQLIGIIGGTGRVTGPHLHWEIWANGVQVEPLDWLEKAFP
jgi:murein DD-endopeptidase MepM/ murein hydrolase activator NlpD